MNTPRTAAAAPDARDIPGWARVGITVFGGLLAGASVIVSSISLGKLAADAGYHDVRAVLFALGFDFAAAVTGLAWAGGRPGSYWFLFGRRATLGLFVASCVFQAAEVFQTKTDPRTGLPLLPPDLLLLVALCVGFLFPTLSVLFGHLVMTVRGAAAAMRAREAAERAAAAEQRAAIARAAMTLASLRLISPPPAATATAAGDSPRSPASAGPGATSPVSGPADDAPPKPIGGSLAEQRKLVGKTVRLIRKAQREGTPEPSTRTLPGLVAVSRGNAGPLLRLARAQIEAEDTAAAEAAPVDPVPAVVVPFTLPDPAPAADAAAPRNGHTIARTAAEE